MRCTHAHRARGSAQTTTTAIKSHRGIGRQGKRAAAGGALWEHTGLASHFWRAHTLFYTGARRARERPVAPTPPPVVREVKY